MASKPRTFALKSPHMRGGDIREFQDDINNRFAAWDINKRIVEDGDYGDATRQATREVCVGLGIAESAMKRGVTPTLRTKVRHPDEMRNPQELERSRGADAKAFRAKLRKEFESRGEVVVASGANAPGRPIKPVMLSYVARMSERFGGRIVVTTGTNHSKFTTSGTISDHFVGLAVDIGMAANGGADDSPIGDGIMAAALIEGGVSPPEAKRMARQGGLFNIHPKGMRVQCIWKTMDGGNHHNHVHVGLRV